MKTPVRWVEEAHPTKIYLYKILDKRFGVSEFELSNKACVGLRAHMRMWFRLILLEF